MHRRARLLLASAALAVATALSAAPAAADTLTVDDAVGDSTARTDLRWVEVTHSRADDLFRVRAAMTSIEYGAALVVYVDRTLANPGPELRMVAYADSEWQLYRVQRWGQRGVEIPTCGRVTYSTSTARPIARWRAPRSCLDLRFRVRVSVKIADDGFGTDWVPARRTFLPPVTAVG